MSDEDEFKKHQYGLDFAAGKDNTVFVSVHGSLSAPAYQFNPDPNIGVFKGGFIQNSTIDDIYELFFEGKTIKENGDEFLDVIKRLPKMSGQLDAIETLEFFRRQFFPDEDEK